MDLHHSSANGATSAESFGTLLAFFSRSEYLSVVPENDRRSMGPDRRGVVAAVRVSGNMLQCVTSAQTASKPSNVLTAPCVSPAIGCVFGSRRCLAPTFAVLRHDAQGGVNIPARCPLGFVQAEPTAGRIHSVSDVYLSRIFDLKCLPCDWCLLFATGPTLARRSGNWLTRRQYEIAY